MKGFLPTQETHALSWGGIPTGWSLDDTAAGPYETYNSGAMGCAIIESGGYLYHYPRTTQVDIPTYYNQRGCLRTPVSSWPSLSTRDWEVVSVDVMPRSIFDDDTDYADWIDDIVAAWVAEDPGGRADYSFSALDPRAGGLFQDESGLKWLGISEIYVADFTSDDPETTRERIHRAAYGFEIAADMVTFSNPRVLVDNDGDMWGGNVSSMFKQGSQHYFLRIEGVDKTSLESPTGYARQYSRLLVQAVDMDATADATQGAALPGAPGVGFPVIAMDPTAASEIIDLADGDAGGPVQFLGGQTINEDGYWYSFVGVNCIDIVQSRQYNDSTMTDPAVNYGNTDAVKYQDAPEGIVCFRCAEASVADGSAWEKSGYVAAQSSALKSIWLPNIITVNDQRWLVAESNFIHCERTSEDLPPIWHRHYGFWSSVGNSANPGTVIFQFTGSALTDLFEVDTYSEVYIKPFGSDGYLSGSGSVTTEPVRWTVEYLQDHWRLSHGGLYLENPDAPNKASLYWPARVLSGEKRFVFGGGGDPDWPGPYDPATDDPSYSGPGADKAGLIGPPPGARPQQWRVVSYNGGCVFQNRWNGMFLTRSGAAVYLDRWQNSTRQLWRVMGA